MSTVCVNYISIKRLKNLQFYLVPIVISKCAGQITNKSEMSSPLVWISPQLGTWLIWEKGALVLWHGIIEDWPELKKWLFKQRQSEQERESQGTHVRTQCQRKQGVLRWMILGWPRHTGAVGAEGPGLQIKCNGSNGRVLRGGVIIKLVFRMALAIGCLDLLVRGVL